MNKLAALLALSTVCACAPVPTLPTDAGAADRTTPTDAVVTPDVPVAADVPVARDVPAVDAAAGDGAILPPYDAGNPFDDAGSLGEPPWANMEVLTRGTCTPLVPCGGSELGTWDVSGGCVEVPIEAQLAMCPGARVSRTVGRARGRVTFASGFANRTAQWEVEVEIFVPGLCAGFVGGCPGIQGSLRGFVPNTTCVTEGAGDCRCVSRAQGDIHDADTYTTMNNQIVSSLARHHWDYCVNGTHLRYHDVTPVTNVEPGIIELVHR